MKRYFAIVMVGLWAMCGSAWAQAKPSGVTPAEIRALTAELINNHAKADACDEATPAADQPSDRCMKQWQKADDGGETAAYQTCLDKSDGGVGMEMCNDEEAARQDKALNVVYQAVRSRLNAKGQAQVQKTQRAWLAYRDAVCDETTIPDGDSQDARLHGGNCFVEVTTDRVKGLRRLFSQLLYFEHDPNSRSILNDPD